MATFPDTTSLSETRAALENLIEAAIARLDELDGDPDLEPNIGASESDCLCGSDWPPAWVVQRSADLPDECEAVSEDEGAACDDEGVEDDHEPSLGSLNRLDQEGWGAFDGSSSVIDGEENGDEFDDDRCRLPPGSKPKARRRWSRTSTAEKCLEAAHDLRAVQKRHGGPLSPLPMVVAGALFKR